MNKCKTVQRKIVAGQELSSSEVKHIDECEGCRSILATHEAALAAARAHAELDEPSVSGIAAVRSYLDVKPINRATGLEWVAASLLIAVIALGTVFMASDLSHDGADQDQQLLALLDEVSEITDPYQSDSTGSDDDTALCAIGALFEETNSEENSQLDLPPTYEVLEEALDNSWL